jgi:hypothetical protein
MTVGELIDILQKCRREDKVLLVERGDSNSFSHLRLVAARYLGVPQVPKGMVMLVPEYKEIQDENSNPA